MKIIEEKWNIMHGPECLYKPEMEGWWYDLETYKILEYKSNLIYDINLFSKKA